jgi:hypothetical protein
MIVIERSEEDGVVTFRTTGAQPEERISLDLLRQSSSLIRLSGDDLFIVGKHYRIVGYESPGVLVLKEEVTLVPPPKPEGPQREGA